MQFNTNKEDLLQVLSAVNKAVPTKTAFPIMECVLLELKDGTLKATATDGAMTIVASTDVESEDNGRICVGAKFFLDFASMLPDGDVKVSTSDVTLTADYGKGKFTLPTYSAEDFPAVDIPEQSFDAVKVSKKALKGALSYVIPSMANDNMRPQLCGVFFDPTDGGYNLVTTDAHTLSMERIECEGSASDFILPTPAVAFLKGTLKGDDDVFFSVADTTVTFYFDSIALNVTKVVGAFPKYQSIIPANNQCTLTAAVADLLGAVKRVATCSNKATNALRMELSQINGATIEAQDTGFGCAAHEDAPYVKYEGEDMVVGFKHDYLADILGAIEEEEVVLALDNPRKAVLVSTANENRKALIMPIAVS